MVSYPLWMCAESKLQADEAKLAARRKPVEEEEDAPGIASVNTAVMSGTISLPGATASEEEEAEDEDIPDLIDTQLATLQDVLDRSDLVLQVVDARDIAGGRSKFVESMVKDAGGQFGLIINKIGKLLSLSLSHTHTHMNTQPRHSRMLTPRSCSPGDIIILVPSPARKHFPLQIPPQHHQHPIFIQDTPPSPARTNSRQGRAHLRSDSTRYCIQEIRRRAIRSGSLRLA